MNWQQFIDKAVGDKPTFTNNEARQLARKTLEFCTDNWVKQRR